MRITNFASWLKLAERNLRQDANHFRGLDPDLIEMRLPLATKVRMQRERNYARLLDERKQWFEERISLKGFVEWWS